MPLNPHAQKWVDEVSHLCRPDKTVVCNGGEEERARLTTEAVKSGELLKLNPDAYPGCYLHRSHSNDVARSEQQTFICTPTADDSGPTNNWMAPAEAYDRVGGVLRGAMQGRTMYVVPFLMGPPGSPFTKVGVEVTDSIYVVLNMRIMTRMGDVALEHLGESDDFTRCLHAKADLNPQRRYICHFPQDNTVWSVGSGYGGNALLGKKCLALRIASYLGRREGWLAEHMLILGVQSPDGRIEYLSAAFPSACGKTNLAMLVPPRSHAGWKVWCVGDDIAWLRIGPDGRLWAMNPEAGFFGVVPGTSRKTNPNAVDTIQRNTIFTNVALKPDRTPWWEGADGEPPAEALDWQNRPWTPKSPEKAAHPNSRFTTPASQCPAISPEWEKPSGVPLSAILFGARRKAVVPLIYESFDWPHGTFLGATMASETTAAAAGQVGLLRRDPMAMIPFCGYNMADYFGHWVAMGRRIPKPPKIFRVNWFRAGESGKPMWPGFGENLRVLRWALSRSRGEAAAQESPIGYVPTPNAVDLDGLDLAPPTAEAILRVDRQEWRDALPAQQEFFSKFGDRLPKAMWDEHQALARRLGVER